MQKHATKCGQEHAIPTGGDIALTVKPCWPIRSLKKAQILTSQQAKNHGYTGFITTLQPVQLTQAQDFCIKYNNFKLSVN